MTPHEDRQAQLLDAYLTALQENRDALAPADLDPEMAEFARMMVGEASAEPSVASAEERIWETLQNEQSPTNVVPYIIEEERDPYMTQLKEKNKRSGRRTGWLPLVVTAAASVLVTLFLTTAIFSTQDREARNQADQLEATQLVVTATPFPQEGILATDTVSPITATSFVLETTSPIVTTMQPTVPPPATLLPTSTPDTFMVRATELIETATSAAFQQSISSNTCNFDGEFDFSISADRVRNNDRLSVAWEAFNTNTVSVEIEIFGGFLTDDEYQTIVTFSDESLRFDSVYQIEILGSDYQNGSYLVGIRLRDGNGETLSSCALPVTFIE